MFEELLREISEEQRYALRYWIKSRIPAPNFRIQFHPETMIRNGIEDFYKEQNKDLSRHFSEDYPLGVSYGGCLNSNGDPNLIKEEIFAPNPQYKTLVGQISIGGNDLLRRLVQEMKGSDRMLKIYCPLEVTKNCWLPNTLRPDQIEASEYSSECQRLQATKAGRKAKRLLLENLSEEQTDDYFRRGYFFVAGHDDEYKPEFQPRRYVIERGYPNGNITSVIYMKATNGKSYLFPVYTFCFHAEEPHPIDDILLSQKLFIENYEVEFLKTANISKPHYPTSDMEYNLRTY